MSQPRSYEYIVEVSFTASAGAVATCCGEDTEHANVTFSTFLAKLVFARVFTVPSDPLASKSPDHHHAGLSCSRSHLNCRRAVSRAESRRARRAPSKGERPIRNDLRVVGRPQGMIRAHEKEMVLEEDAPGAHLGRRRQERRPPLKRMSEDEAARLIAADEKAIEIAAAKPLPKGLVGKYVRTRALPRAHAAHRHAVAPPPRARPASCPPTRTCRPRRSSISTTSARRR